MAMKLIEDSTLTGIADEIRNITGTSNQMTPAEMIDELYNYYPKASLKMATITTSDTLAATPYVIGNYVDVNDDNYFLFYSCLDANGKWRSCVYRHGVNGTEDRSVYSANIANVNGIDVLFALSSSGKTGWGAHANRVRTEGWNLYTDKAHGKKALLFYASLN